MSSSDPLRSIFALFDISFNTDELDRGSSAVDTLAGKLKNVVKAFAGFKVVQGIIGWGEHVAEAAREVEFGAIKAGMGIEEFQKLNQVAEKYGTTAEQLTISTRLFVRSLRDAGGTAADFHSHSKLAADAFHDLGINAAQFKGKSFAEILPVVADGFAKIGKGTRATADALVLFGHRGIGILPLMLKGGENLRKEMQAMQPVFEAATIEAADRAVVSGKALGFTWEHLVNNVFGRPLLNALSKGADYLDKVVKGIYELTKASEIGRGTLVVLGIAIAVAGVAGAVAFWSWLWPLAAAAAAFAAIALAVDDFIVFLRGGDSVLGDFFDMLLGPGGAEKSQKFFKEDLPGWLAKVRDWIVDELIPAAQKWLPSLDEVSKTVKIIKDDFGRIVDFVDKITAFYSKFFSGGSALGRAIGNSVGMKPGETSGSAEDVSGLSTMDLMNPLNATPERRRELSKRLPNVGNLGFWLINDWAKGFGGGGGDSVPAPDGANYSPAGPNMSSGPAVSQVFNVSGGDPAEVQEAARRGAQEAINQTLRDTNASFGGAQ